jgi:hypothetical protein
MNKVNQLAFSPNQASLFYMRVEILGLCQPCCSGKKVFVVGEMASNHRDKTRVQMPAKIFPHLKVKC